MGYRDSTGSPDGGPDAQQHDYHAARVDPSLTRPARGHRGPITTDPGLASGGELLARGWSHCDNAH